MDLEKIPDYARFLGYALVIGGLFITGGLLFMNARYDRRHRKLQAHLDHQHAETLALFKDQQEQAGIKFRATMHAIDKLKRARDEKGRYKHVEE